MIKVMTHGTFDILHHGHIEYLRKAKAHGDYLIVLLTTDEFAKKWNKSPYYNYEQRKKLLEAIRYVDLVIPQEDDNNAKLMDEFKCDVFIETEEFRGYSFMDDKKYNVIYLSRTPEISSSKVKKEVFLSK